MSHLLQLQQWLKTNRLQGVLIPSTDEFLSEFTPLASQRLWWVTGFKGSVGLAIVLQDRAALLVDGRYTLQAQVETTGLRIDILPMSEAAQEGWLTEHLRRADRLALDPALHAFPDVEKLQAWTEGVGVDLVMLTGNPVDDLWGRDRPPVHSSAVYDHPLKCAGQSSVDKCAAACQWLVQRSLDGYLVCDPEDLAWLLNVRANDWPIVPVCLSHVLLEAGGQVTWFVDKSRLMDALVVRLGKTVDIVAPTQLEARLSERAQGKTLGANLRRTPYKLANIVIEAGNIKNDPFIEHRRWIKNSNQIEGARKAHHLDGQAVIRFLAWLARAIPERRVTELEAADQLSAFRETLLEYKGPSMPLMSASGPSSALPHYVPSQQSNRALNDHPIYWIDSGGHYFCGSTDNTASVALGEPQPKHKIAHTLVLKGFIALATVRFPGGTLASQLDSFARQFLWKQGMDYAHGTGHGVGSFMNIHEGPVIGKYHVHTPLNAPIEPGMILSNEPAYYAADDFGVRIESHILVIQSPYEGFLEFETLSRLPIDPRLVETSLLTLQEKRWLADYHRRIGADYDGQLDELTTAWLKERVDFFVC